MAKKKLDLIGKAFAKLLVLDFSHIQNGKSFWKCLCQCGKETIVCGAELNRGHVKTCGCRLNIYNTLDSKVLAANNIFHIYKNSALKRKIDFDINSDDVYLFIYGNCHYCGVYPATKHIINTVKTKPIIYYNGIDRIASDKGYNKNNCITACKTCNYAKRDMSYQDFLSWIAKLIIYQTNISGEEIKINTESMI